MPRNSKKSATKTTATAAPESIIHPATRRSWRAAKARNPKAVVGVRSGDFLEFHSTCAEIVSDVCGVVITHQRAGSPGAGTPRVGIPGGEAARRYIDEIEGAGFSVLLIGRKHRRSDDDAELVADHGSLARINADLAELDRIRRLGHELDDAWKANDRALAHAKRARSAAARLAADGAEAAALAEVARIEADMAASKPRSDDDALALATLLTDKLAAIEPAVEGDNESRRDHAAAANLARSLVQWLMGETGRRPVDIGMGAYYSGRMHVPQ